VEKTKTEISKINILHPIFISIARIPVRFIYKDMRICASILSLLEGKNLLGKRVTSYKNEEKRE